MNLIEKYDIVKKNIDSIDFSSLWPNFHLFNFALYNEDEACFNRKIIEKPQEFIANTAINYQGEWVAIFISDENDDLDILTSKIIHEMFHAFQYDNKESRFSNEMDAIVNYDYSVKNLSLKLHENSLLVKMIKDGFNKQDYNDFMQSKKFREKNYNYSFNYEMSVEQIEGCANYVELLVLQLLNKDLYKRKLDYMLKNLISENELFPIRIGLYDSGALLIKLLSENGININHSFTNIPFVKTLLEDVKYQDIEIKNSLEVEEAINIYYNDIKNKINTITINKPIIEGTYQLTGVNVYDAKYYDGYIYSTYFVCYNDGEDKFLQGNYLIDIKDNKIRIFKE